MCQPCCERTYAKYQTSPGAVNMETIRELFGLSAIVEVREDRESDMAKWIYSREQRWPQQSFLLIDGKESDLCTCMCHTHGVDVIH